MKLPDNFVDDKLSDFLQTYGLLGQFIIVFMNYFNLKNFMEKKYGKS